MLQPFEPFKAIYINKLLELGKTYLVSQTYTRASDPFTPTPKTPILLTDYDDMGLVAGHLRAISDDKFGAVIDLNKDPHRKKVLEMLSPGSQYVLYWGVVKNRADLETAIDLKYKDHMRRYIRRHTNWRIDRNATIMPALKLIFGELFIILKFGGESRRISLAELERS